MAAKLQEYSLDSDDLIPLTTLARLFQNVAFRSEKTRITKRTLELSSSYINLFVNEALIRSNEARIQEGDKLTKVDGIDNLEGAREAENPNNDAEVNDTLFADTLNNSTVMKDNLVDGASNATLQESDDIFSDDNDDANEKISSTQSKTAFNSDMDLGNETLDTKHLSKIAGILVLDF